MCRWLLPLPLLLVIEPVVVETDPSLLMVVPAGKNVIQYILQLLVVKRSVNQRVCLPLILLYSSDRGLTIFVKIQVGC